MPKGKIQDPNRPKARRPIAVTRKSKIGGRKSTRSALMLSTEELQKIVDGSGRGKDKMRAQNELTRRYIILGRPSRIIAEMIETAKGMVAAGTSDQELVDELKSL